MLSNYDVVKEQMSIIRQQQELIKDTDRMNLVLLCVIWSLLIVSFLESAWKY